MPYKSVEERREYHRQWRLKNHSWFKEYRLHYQRKWRKKNLDKAEEYKRRWCESRRANIEKCLARERRYRLNNRDMCCERTRNWGLKNKEHLRRYQREDRKEYRRKYNDEHPEIYEAHRLVNNAIRRGELVRKVCWCGKKGQAHHEDYTKPFQITWLCGKHHNWVHRGYEYAWSRR